jgi:hypothetical protein
MTNTISSQTHVDPRALRQQNHSSLPPLEPTSTGAVETPREKNTPVSDTVTISPASVTAAASSSSLTIKGDGFDLLRGLVLNMLREQGIDVKVATNAAGAEEINISQLSQEDAQALIADDGYFGVDKTSSRIVDFAIGIAGGDPSRLEAIKEGVDKGFAEALKAFGGQLPDISYDTYDAVMKKLDDWAENTDANQPASIRVLNRYYLR